MSLDYAAINASLFNRAAADTAGASVRALTGANGIFERPQLRNTAGRVFPWLVWAEIDASGASGDMRPMVGSWWLYVPQMAAGNVFQLLTLATAIEALYGGANYLAIASGRVGIVYKGRSFEDAPLTALGMEMRIEYRRRG